MLAASQSLLVLRECSAIDANDVSRCAPGNEHVRILSRQRHNTFSRDDVTWLQRALRGACVELGDVMLVSHTGNECLVPTHQNLNCDATSLRSATSELDRRKVNSMFPVPCSVDYHYMFLPFPTSSPVCGSQSRVTSTHWSPLRRPSSSVTSTRRTCTQQCEAAGALACIFLSFVYAFLQQPISIFVCLLILGNSRSATSSMTSRSRTGEPRGPRGGGQAEVI